MPDQKLKVMSYNSGSGRWVNLTVKRDDNGRITNARNVAACSAWGWGKWDYSRKIDTSFGPAWWVATPSHGGVILVSDKKLPFEWPHAYTEELGDLRNVWIYEFEEDCAWAYLAFEDEVASESMRTSVDWLKESTRDDWEERVLQVVERYYGTLINAAA